MKKKFLLLLSLHFFCSIHCSQEPECYSLFSQQPMSLWVALKIDDNLKTFKNAIIASANVNERQGGTPPLLWHVISSYWDYGLVNNLFTKKSWEEVIALLIHYKARLTVRSRIGRTVLHEAAMVGSGTVIDFLIHAGMSVHVEDKNKNTPLHDLFKGNLVKIDCLDALQKLILAGVDINAKNVHLTISLHNATYLLNEENSKKIIPYMLFYGADAEYKDKQGNKAVDFTKYKSIKKMFKNRETVRKAVVHSEPFKKEFCGNVFYALKSREYTGKHKRLPSCTRK
jgi:hypothetical protein